MVNHYKTAAAIFIACLLLPGACSRSESAAAAQAAAGKPAVVKEAVKPVCATCGVVNSITPLNIKGEGSGIGAVLGAIAGGLAGNQVGGGNGRKIATVAGAVGGAVLGNTIEKNRNDEHYYRIGVNMENGGYTTVTVPDTGGLTVGSTVLVEGSNIRRR